jgi:hypothetical protein
MYFFNSLIRIPVLQLDHKSITSILVASFVAHGSITSVDKIKASYCQKYSNDDISQAGKTPDASLDCTHCIARKSWMMFLFISRERIF